MRACFPAVLLALGVAAGCSSGVSDKDLSFVDPAAAQKMLDERGGILGLGEEKKAAYVDPRKDSDWREGHIHGAVHLPFQYLSTHAELLDGYDNLIVYGTAYNDPLAEAMSKRLIELGFKHVDTLHGGLEAWAHAGYEVESGSEGVFVEIEVVVE